MFSPANSCRLRPSGGCNRSRFSYQIAGDQNKRPGMSASVDIGDITLTYRGASGDILALKGASLNVRRGEFAAVVGPSGCGKSSLMKLVTGLIPPDDGSIVISGTRVTGPVKIAGMAFQNPSLLPWRTVIDNVLLPLEIVQPYRQNFRREKAQYREQVVNLLNAVGLGGFGERYPWELSGGMQQRASLCRALIHQPSLLMLDEPFAALDAFTREELWCVLRDLWQEINFTVLLVTHDLREATFLADTVHVMSARPGRIVTSKTVDLPRPRDINVCFEPQFTDIVHELRTRIGEVRQA
jgi:NitT/TauT family transport system ATP-binding protein